MVAATTAPAESERVSLEWSLRTLLRMPGVAVAAFVAAPLVAVLAVLASIPSVPYRYELTIATWVAASLLGLVALLLSIAGSTQALERSIRVGLAGAFACSTGWILIVATDDLDRRLAMQPEDLLLVVGGLFTAYVLRVLMTHRISEVDALPFLLDAGCLVMAILTMLVAVLGSHAQSGAAGLFAVAYPAAFFATTAVALLALLAERLRISARGAFLLLPATLLVGIGTAAWVDEWVTGSPVPVLPAPPFALALVLSAIGIATTGTDLPARKGAVRWAGPVRDALPLAAVACAALVLLAMGDQASDVGLLRAVTALTVVFALAREALLLRSRIVVLRDLDKAEAETAAALERATAAETQQRLRADHLARVLQASEALAVAGDGEVSFEEMLAAITPEGASSFLARFDAESRTYTAVAFWGPGTRDLPAWDRREVPVPPSSLGYYSASGRTLRGERVTAAHFGAGDGPQAALAVPLFDRTGTSLGALHLVDPIGERILDPEFVALAQLVANQVAVALENQALVVRVHAQLEEVQRVQGQLIQATKLGAIGELAAAVAHEVNNPLTGILGFSDLLLTELPADDPRHEEVAIIRSEAVRARSIMRALIEFARPRPPQRAPTDVNALTRETIDLVRFRADEAGVRLIEAYGPVPTTELDPGAIKQVLLNLLNNALRATPGGGELRVTTAADGDRITVIVADDGVGMDAETRENIFSPFFTTASPGLGAGLGLSVSLQIVEAHGGSIEVDTAPGRGSTFTVHLPMTRAGSAE